GSPSGLMSARGAADFLTRSTTILATLFVVFSIILAGMATVARAPIALDKSLAPPTSQAPATQAPAPALDPLAGAAQQSTAQTATNQTAPAPAPAPKQ
ncbi:MAG TPA: preprotein translocase subunit SecG, partial [Allosphingosinicella sp.]|nr:preprotein translocase subunit SecG [Allosphingosinicella sp.]